MWVCMCWTCPFKFRWSRGFIYNSSSNLRNQHFPLLSYFSVIVCEVVIISYAVGFTHICVSWNSWVLHLWLLCSLMMSANNRLRCGLVVVFGYFHITLHHWYHYANLFEDMELLKCLSDIFCSECASKIRSVPTIIFHAIYGAVCIKPTHFLYADCDNTSTWSYHQHQIGSMI